MRCSGTDRSRSGRNVDERAGGGYSSRMRRTSLLALVVLVLAATTAEPAPSAALEVEPGLWEFRSTMNDPFGGELDAGSHRACVRDRRITPDMVMARMKQCRITNAVVKGTAATWRMSCQTPAGPMTGTGSLRSNGSAVKGSLDMTMAAGSFEVPVSGRFQGRRVGACR